MKDLNAMKEQNYRNYSVYDIAFNFSRNTSLWDNTKLGLGTCTFSLRIVYIVYTYITSLQDRIGGYFIISERVKLILIETLHWSRDRQEDPAVGNNVIIEFYQASAVGRLGYNFGKSML